ncbi:glycosyl transferase (plasmid) [Lactiplantibacillus plantarum]|nr:glycosyltransferase [Lactiplantibacillus plantarum]WHQ52976.1 glycosyl transferase [Lactiplantibacillus plantarum]WHQ67491.1 glycosyl transferase [Lactiplantibacillus plantarum]
MKIFVTVATHEQSFTRLMKQIELAAKDNPQDEFYVQYGYSVVPKGKNIHCEKFMTYSHMKEMYQKCDCVVMHAGPASMFDALNAKITPIIVPRYHDLNEHVNNHQVEFTKFLESKDFPIIAVYQDDPLEGALDDVRKGMAVKGYKSHQQKFCSDLENIIEQLVS